MSSFKKTGDIKGNTESLIRNLKLIKYPSQTNFKILSSGNPEIYLPIIHYSLFNYSPLVAKFLSDKHYDMYAKNDLDFINTAFKCLLSLFNYRPDINTNQFFSNGYAEGKIILCKEIIDIVLQKDSELSKKKKSSSNANKYSKDSYKNDNNNNNNSPRFHELNNSKNSQKKNSNTNAYMDDNNNLGNCNNSNNVDLNNINNNFNASLPMNSIPVPTPKPQYLIKNNLNYNNIQSSVQSFKPKTSNNNNNNNNIEIYDSSQEYPLESNPNANLQNYIESKINTNNNNLNNDSNNSNVNYNNLINRNDYSNENQKNNNDINNSNKTDDNYINSYYSNSLNKKNIYNQDEINNENIIKNNKNRHNQIFTSFGQNITLNPEGNNYEENNSKIYYDQSMNNINQKNFTAGAGYTPYLEENKVFNVFSCTQANEESYNNNISNNNYNMNNISNNDSNDIKNKYADIDKLIENSEKNFFKTQKLLEDYDNTDVSKKKPNL